MKNFAIARRYAKALLLIGREDGQAETYKQELDGFARLMAQERELERAVINPLYTSSQRRRVLQAVMERLNLSPVMASFINLLFDKRRIAFLDVINEFYQKLVDEFQGVARASLVSATELSSETIDKIRATLSKKTGREVVLEVEQDPALIGGIVTRIGDLVLDGSIRTQLLNMRESLKRGESV